MATPKDTVWDRDAHTAAKHDLLRRYLSAWVPILLSHYRRVTYAEGFAGPGTYTRSEPGSPINAVETFNQYADLLALPSREAQLVFVEEVPKRVARLEQELEAVKDRLGPLPANLRVHPPIKGDCADVLETALGSCGASGNPMFVFLDSFGGPDIPFDLLRLVAGNRSSEVLLTFQPQFLMRHGERDAHRASGDRAFGGPHWRAVFEQAPDRKLRYLVEAYRRTLTMAGFLHSLGFVMLDEGGHEIWLLFATSNPLGVEKMKEAMWAVDPVHGVRYRDPRDPDQMLLDIDPTPDAAPLRRMIVERLHAGSQTLDEVREWVNLNTVYKKTQVRGSVRELLKAGLVTRDVAGHLAGETTLTVAAEPQRPAPDEQGSLF